MKAADPEGQAPSTPASEDMLKLGAQLCFPLYVCAKEIVRRYKPFLDPLDLTYTQYIVMMVLWETPSLSVKELGQRLFLDSGTLTPLLKKLEAKELITRSRSAEDERLLTLALTPQGAALKKQALAVPAHMCQCLKLSPPERDELRQLLNKLQAQFK